MRLEVHLIRRVQQISDQYVRGLFSAVMQHGPIVGFSSNAKLVLRIFRRMYVQVG